MSENLVEQVFVSMKDTVAIDIIEYEKVKKLSSAEYMKLKQLELQLKIEETLLKKLEIELEFSRHPDKYMQYLELKRKEKERQEKELKEKEQTQREKEQKEKKQKDASQVDFFAFAKKWGTSHFFPCVHQSASTHWLGFNYSPIGSDDIDDAAFSNSGKRKLE